MAKILDFDAALRKPPESVWIVFGKEGPQFVTAHRQLAMEHAGDMAATFPTDGPWCVCEYTPMPAKGA